MTTAYSDQELDKLLAKAYSELTEEEAEAVIEWKASVKARDTAFQQILDQHKEHYEALIAEYDAERDASVTAQLENTRRALEREQRLKDVNSSE